MVDEQLTSEKHNSENINKTSRVVGLTVDLSSI